MSGSAFHSPPPSPDTEDAFMDSGIEADIDEALLCDNAEIDLDALDMDLFGYLDKPGSSTEAAPEDTEEDRVLDAEIDAVLDGMPEPAFPFVVEPRLAWCIDPWPAHGLDSYVDDSWMDEVDTTAYREQIYEAYKDYHVPDFVKAEVIDEDVAMETSDGVNLDSYSPPSGSRDAAASTSTTSRTTHCSERNTDDSAANNIRRFKIPKIEERDLWEDEFVAEAVARTIQEKRARHHCANKPKIPYSAMVALALIRSESKVLAVQDIYTFICDHWPYYERAQPAWRNSVRHTLSLNNNFKKIELSSIGLGRKSCRWTIRPERMNKVEKVLAKYAAAVPEPATKVKKQPIKNEPISREDHQHRLAEFKRKMTRKPHEFNVVRLRPANLSKGAPLMKPPADRSSFQFRPVQQVKLEMPDDAYPDRSGPSEYRPSAVKQECIDEGYPEERRPANPSNFTLH